MNSSLLSLTVIALACSCTSIKPESNKPPSYYGRSDAEIAAMEAQMGAASSSSSQTMRTEYRHPYKRGDLAILIGSRQMKDKTAWKPVSSQLTGGINWTWEPSGSIIGFDTAFFYSEDSSSAQTGPAQQTTIRGETYEFSMGGIKSIYLGRSPLRAYLGAGVSLMSARLERVQGGFVNSGSDTGFGGYGRVGLVYQIAWDGHIGFDYRTLVGTSNEINGYGFDSDYDQFTFNFGTSF
ncbi:MAG: hypothetical protein H6831_08915 [Planctomycetes bacterium]|nr:hypothetical protein [Planctomycetota bacterium]MCB9904512.1 hypothetical protein [Planctomycetota bacterium]